MSQQGPLGYGTQAAAPKKTNPLVWVGAGCAILIFLGLGAALAIYIAVRKAGSGGVAAAGAFSAGVRVEVDGGDVSVDAGVSTGVPSAAPRAGGSSCEKAANCCRRAVAKTGATAAALASCDALRTNVSEADCAKALETYKASPFFSAVCL